MPSVAAMSKTEQRLLVSLRMDHRTLKPIWCCFLYSSQMATRASTLHRDAHTVVPFSCTPCTVTTTVVQQQEVVLQYMLYGQRKNIKTPRTTRSTHELKLLIVNCTGCDTLLSTLPDKRNEVYPEPLRSFVEHCTAEAQRSLSLCRYVYPSSPKAWGCLPTRCRTHFDGKPPRGQTCHHAV